MSGDEYATSSVVSKHFNDFHIFSLPSQGGVYTFCRLPFCSANGVGNGSSRCRLLAASLRRPVYLLEFSVDNKQSLVPYSRELAFTYLPGLHLMIC